MPKIKGKMKVGFKILERPQKAENEKSLILPSPQNLCNVLFPAKGWKFDSYQSVFLGHEPRCKVGGRLNDAIKVIRFSVQLRCLYSVRSFSYLQISLYITSCPAQALDTPDNQLDARQRIYLFT